MTEVDRLAHEVAERAARVLIDSCSILEEEDGREWRNLDDKEFDYLAELDVELKYLELRGILRRHPTERHRVRVLSDEERAETLAKLAKAYRRMAARNEP
jgi:hypothetical protein